MRIASQAWIVFFSSIVKSIGVVSGTVEPCLYVGRMVGKDQAPIVIMAYVDDLLVATTSESALKTLMTALSAHVKVRETGRVGLKGGHLRLMSLFWKKMKALFLQTKICEVSQIRINKNPLGLVVNKHLLKVETSNQTW